MSRERWLDLTFQARDDIAEVLDASALRFGQISRRRYEALLVRALEDLRLDPQRPGSLARPELGQTSVPITFGSVVTAPRLLAGVLEPPDIWWSMSCRTGYVFGCCVFYMTRWTLPDMSDLMLNSPFARHGAVFRGG